MTSTPPKRPTSESRLESSLGALARGERVSGDVLRQLRPRGVMGALLEMPLTEVLQNMDFAKKSGRVDVWPEGAEGAVHVHDGQIVHAVATTAAGTTEGEAAVLELCRVPEGFFRIHYAREDVERNIHRPTTFVLLEALRMLDEAASRAKAVPAAIELGFDAHFDASPAKNDEVPAFLLQDEEANPFNDPSAVLDIEVAADDASSELVLPAGGLMSLIAESEFLVAAGDLAAARRVLSRARGLAPEDDDVRQKLLSVNETIDAAQANALLDQATRGGPQAVDMAVRATQLRPVRDVLLRSLAVFARGGAHDEIADVAEQLLELDPDDEGALRTLVEANLKMKRYAVALRAAEGLARLRPSDEQVRATLQRVAALAAQNE